MTKIYFSDDHEYVRFEGGIGVAGAEGQTAFVGISDYAQKALGDVVYVELPKVGTQLEKGAQAGVVESVKSASEVYTPVSGEVIEVNAALTDDPALVNRDPMGAAWFFKIKIANNNDLATLKDEENYATFIEGL